MKIKYNGGIVDAETIELNYVRVTGTDVFLSLDQYEMIEEEEMRKKICGILDTRFGAIGFALTENPDGSPIAVLFEPYLDKDDEPTWDYQKAYPKNSPKSQFIVVRGIPYNARVEIIYRDGEWQHRYDSINRSDSKKYVVSPSDSAKEAIKAEFIKVWKDYIVQHPEYLTEIKIGSLEAKRAELEEKNADLLGKIKANEKEINSLFEILRSIQLGNLL
jgi:hypothetical protein